MEQKRKTTWIMHDEKKKTSVEGICYMYVNKSRSIIQKHAVLCWVMCRSKFSFCKPES